MTDKPDHLVWLDMEMTGLDPVACVPIEVAVVITTADLVEVDHVEHVIWQPESKLTEMEPFVTNMHTNNGLLAKVRASEISCARAERSVLSLLSRYTKPGDGVLCGNSIHQDRKFIERYFPAVHGYLHYRMIDVSTIKELAKRWYGSAATFNKPESDHTALSDTRGSIAELAFFRKTLFVPKDDK